MKKYRVMTLSLFLASVMAVAFVGCGGEPAEAPAVPAPGPGEPIATPAEPAAAPAEPAAAAAESDGSATEAAAPAESDGSATEAAAGVPLTVETIVGTSWDAEGKILTFEKDGVLKVKLGEMEVEGTWSIEGTTLSAGAMGQSVEATLDGDKIMIDGQELPRVQ